MASANLANTLTFYVSCLPNSCYAHPTLISISLVVIGKDLRFTKEIYRRDARLTCPPSAFVNSHCKGVSYRHLLAGTYHSVVLKKAAKFWRAQHFCYNDGASDA